MKNLLVDERLISDDQLLQKVDCSFLTQRAIFSNKGSKSAFRAEFRDYVNVVGCFDRAFYLEYVGTSSELVQIVNLGLSHSLEELALVTRERKYLNRYRFS